MENRVKKIHALGQSVWLDFIDRKIMDSGELQKLITDDGVRGVTSNLAIFAKAIASSTDYDQDIGKLSKEGKSNDDIFYGVAIKDIQRAADLFRDVYEDREVRGADGYVSLEVLPRLALDSEGTIKQALELWDALQRNNVMIKIPGTKPGLAAIQKCICEGLNINVTLLFGLERYEAVTEAYIVGLEQRAAAGNAIENVSSVASFFLSRIDLAVDPLLKSKGLTDLTGKVAIASAKKAYEIYKRVFSTDRWKKLELKGAKPQRLLWASTGSKDPAFSDVKYVEALIGKDTVNTVPMDTLTAFRDHGKAEDLLGQGLDQAKGVLTRVSEAGIDLNIITARLEEEGIAKFVQPYNEMLEAIEKQKRTQNT